MRLLLSVHLTNLFQIALQGLELGGGSGKEGLGRRSTGADFPVAWYRGGDQARAVWTLQTVKAGCALEELSWAHERPPLSSCGRSPSYPTPRSSPVLFY